MVSFSAVLSRVLSSRFLILGLITVSIFTGATDSGGEAAYDNAIKMYRGGDCSAAIPLLASAASAEPQANLPLGECYLETGHDREAITPLSTYVQQFPADDRGVTLLARAYENLNRAQDGIDALTSYLNQNPGSLNARVQLGLIYLKTGDKAKSATEFNTILQKAPNYPGALFGLGLIAFDEQRWPDAINYLSHVTQIAPDQVDAYRALGKVYEQQGQYEKAAGAYDQAFAIMPSDFRTAKALAKCYAKLDKWDDVARALRSGSVEEANDREATGLVERALAKSPQALEEYCRGVIAQNPRNTAALQVLAEFAYSSKQMDRAKAEYIEILKLEGNDPDPHTSFNLGQIFEAEQKIEDARNYYEKATRSKSATAQMHLALARIELALNNAPGAKATLSKVGSPDSDSPDAKAVIAEADLRTGDLEGASSLLADLLARDPNNRKLLDLGAQSAEKEEKYAEAVALLERLLQADSGDKAVRYRLIVIYTNHPELKEESRAMELLTDFASKQEEDPEGYLLLANLYRRNKDFVNAKIYFDLGFKKMPNPIPPRFAWAYTSYANLLFTQGQFEDALTEGLQATQLNPNDPQAQLTLGFIYLKLKRRDDLAEVVGKLKENDPNLASQLEEMARRSGLPVKVQAEQ